jgi:hypothetical protein
MPKHGGQAGEGKAKVSGQSRLYKLLAKDYPSPDELRELLAGIALGVLAKRYLHSGLPHVFADCPHKYVAFCESAAKLFGARARDVAIMGSARFGFSIAPDSFGKALSGASDADVMVIAPALYEDEVSEFAARVAEALEHFGSAWKLADDQEVKLEAGIVSELRGRALAIRFGFLDPSRLPDRDPRKQDLFDKMEEAGTQLLGTAPPGPVSKVGVRVFRDWEAAERNVEHSLRTLANRLGLKVPIAPTELGEQEALAAVSPSA